MTIPAISASQFFNALATASANAAQAAQQQELKQIDAQIQNKLNNQITALQNNANSASITVSQAQVTELDKQKTAASALETSYGTNATLLSALTAQLGKLQTDAASGDATDFDTDLVLANTDLQDLKPVTPPGSLLPDGIAPLQANGLGIGNSASYDLSTASGIAAAQAAVSAAQAAVERGSQATTSDQIAVGSQVTALSSEIDNLNTTIENEQAAATSANQTQINQLEQAAENQEHLIELALGDSTQLGSALQQALNPPQPINSPFSALVSAIGATPSSINASNAANPPILSLLV
jgi:hypothetical protein